MPLLLAIHTTSIPKMKKVVLIMQRIKSQGGQVMILGTEDQLPEEWAGDERLLILTDDPDFHVRMEAKGMACAYWIPNLLGDDEETDWPTNPKDSYLVLSPEEMDVEDFVRIRQRRQQKPWHILDTKRLILRETSPEDMESFYEIYKDPEITQYMEGLFEDPDEERAYLISYRRNIYEFYEYGVWTVLLRETGEIIGRAGLEPKESGPVELGFVIGKKWQNQGFATEAVQGVIKYARENLDFLSEIRACVDPENTASERICQTAGFLPTVEMEGQFRVWRKRI